LKDFNIYKALKKIIFSIIISFPGSDSHSSEIRSKEQKNNSPKREKPPRKTREKSFRKAQDVRTTDDILKSRESVVDLEWDDAGIQLNEDTDQEQFWRYQGQAFEHSILRFDTKS